MKFMKNYLTKKIKDESVNKLCAGCVYYPPNLPAHAYTKEDWEMLQQKKCSYEYLPGDSGCQLMRKTSCSIVDMKTEQS